MIQLLSTLQEKNLPGNRIHGAVGTPQRHDLDREKSTTCVAKLPRSQKHTWARFLLLFIWCYCITAVDCSAATTTAA